MKIFSILLLSLLLTPALASDKHEQVILTIGEHQFTKGEFLYIYNKNRHLPGFSETINEFSERFINYKLKVVEALEQGLDTLPEFQNEYQKYIQELKASFMVDSAALENVARQAHQNMLEMVNASHILIRMQQGSPPADTLVAWQKINSIKERVIAGENFNDLAVKYSNDPSVRGNRGKLGYFSAFRMVYPFEKAAYSTPVGGVSEITRTDFGYHLIQVHHRRPNPGRITVAHIMKMFPRGYTAEDEARLKATIDSIHQVLIKGGDFAALAMNHSDDQANAWEGGTLPPFAFHEMIPEFAEAAFKLSFDGEISSPVRTPFGWHIIKRAELTPVGSFEQERAHVMSMINRDGRGRAGEEAFVNSKRASSNFILEQQTIDRVVSEMKNDGDNSNQFISRLKEDSNKLVFRYKNQEVTLGTLLDSIENNPTFIAIEGTPALKRVLDQMIEDVILKVEKRDLAKNVPQYRYLANEYHDGLLIFELSSREIWQNVGRDSIALENFYLANSDKFLVQPLLKGVICEVTNRRLARKLSKALSTSNDTLNMLNFLKEKGRRASCFNCIEGKFPFITEATNPIKSDILPKDNPFAGSSGTIFWSGIINEAYLPPLNEIRGRVASAYQEHLEKEWVKSLRERHDPVFNYSLIDEKKSGGTRRR